MALFVAQLAFPATSPSGSALLPMAKLGVLCGSACAAVVGLLLGRLLLPVTSAPGAATSADEAESSTEK
jgi:NhaA family Na+:H+ antiporter